MRLDGQAPLPDAPAAQPDQTPAVTCDKQCTAQAAYLCVTAPSSNACVECRQDSHCVNNPGAAGTRCVTSKNLCECASDADCAGKQLGSKCHANDRVCSCTADADCLAPRKCIGNFFGAKVCKLPCTSDAQCASYMFTKVCDLATGCQECTKTKGCGAQSLGKTCNNGLCSCSSDAECSGNVNGEVCVEETSACGCETDFDCPTGKACTGRYIDLKFCR